MKITDKKIFSINDKDVDLDFSLSEKLNLLSGKNGVGKTTFLRSLKSIDSQVFKSQELSFMDQLPLSPIGSLRVKDVVSTLVENELIVESIFEDLSESFDFKDLYDSPVISLSGGENQLLKFMICHSVEADLYILDEPLQFLDKSNLKKVIIFIQKYISKGRKYLVVEHKDHYFQHMPVHAIKMHDTGSRIEVRDENGN